MLLRSLRTSAGLTQFKLAARAGVTERTVSRIEAGQHGPNARTRQLIAAALGVEEHRITWPERGVRSTAGNDTRGGAFVGASSASPDLEGV